MTAANIELYEVLRALGVSPEKAQAACLSPIDCGLRDIELRLREVSSDIDTRLGQTQRAIEGRLLSIHTHFDAIDLRLRKAERSLAVLIWMTGTSLVGIGSILVAVFLPAMQRFFG